MNNYETVFILTPVLSDAQMKEAVDKIKAVLSAENAEIVNEEDWGLRKLAYPIEKRQPAFIGSSSLRRIRKRLRHWKHNSAATSA